MHDDYTYQAKNEIQEWESKGPGFLTKASNIALWPAYKAAAALIPENVQESVSRATVDFITGLGSAAKLIVREKAIKKRVLKFREEYGYGLKASDEAAKHYWRYSLGYATAEGAATGAMGWLGLTTDIPSLFTISIRLIQQIGLCYGYNIKKEAEQEYVMHILQTGAAGDVRAKMEFMASLKQVEEILKKVSLKKVNESLAMKEIGERSLLAYIRRFAESIGIQMTKRKALQMVPILGAFIGGSFNYAFVKDIGEAAYMSYRRRRIEEDEGVDAASLML